MKNLSFIVVLILVLFLNQNIFAHDVTVSDTTKKEYWLTFSGLYYERFDGNYRFVNTGISIEKQTNNRKISKCLSYYNSYYYYYKANNTIRFSTINFGYKYNFFNRNELSLGLQTGLFIYDRHFLLNNLHSYGISFLPSIDYNYHFKKLKLGFDFFLASKIGYFETSTYINQEIMYEKKLGVGMKAYFNVKLSLKL